MLRRRRPQRRTPDAPPARGLARSRHGRVLRSSVAGPYLPMLTGRVSRFETIVAETMAYLRMVEPERVAPIRVDIAPVPTGSQHDDGIDRWHLLPPDRIVLFRVPIERLGHLHCTDPAHARAHVERCVVDAVAELLDVDPWDLAGDRLGFD